MFNRSIPALAILAACLPFAGCTPQGETENGEEVVGTTSDALITDDGAPNVYRTLGASGTTVGALGTPIGAEYQNDFVPGYWVVEVDGTYQRGLTPIVSYQGPDNPSATTCSKAHVKAMIYGWVAPFYNPVAHQYVPGQWYNLGTPSNTGFFNRDTGHCQLALAIPHIAPAAFSSIRIAGHADLGILENVQVSALAD